MELSKYYKWDEGKKEEAGFASIMNPENVKDGDMFAVYMEILEFGEEILKKAEKDIPVAGKEIEERIDRLVDYIMAGGKFFLEFVFRDLKKESEARHMVNTTILALETALELGYNKSRLFELALGAFLHDIGITKFSSLKNAAKRLTGAEYEEIKKHPVHGLELLKRLGDISQEVIRVVHEHHERLDGSGYPRGIKNGHIHEHAMIVGIVDMFEAMTHDRPYRKRMALYDALKELINMGADVVEPQYVEALVRRIGLYPMGSWVELSSGEIGKVIEINKDFALRPIVSVIYVKGGQKLKEAKVVDISKQPVIFIRKILKDEELADKISQ